MDNLYPNFFSAPVNPKAELRSKIVAEFLVSLSLLDIDEGCMKDSEWKWNLNAESLAHLSDLFFVQPSAFIEHLAKYRKSMDEIELREKQLAAMRVDVCSTAALKKLKGGCCLHIVNFYVGINAIFM